jgi:hypothetical protein
MTTKIRIIHAQDFLKATPEGELNFEESKRILLEIAAIVVTQDDYALIIDTRKAHSVMSPTDLWLLAKEIGTFGEKFRRKTAVICPHDRFDQAKFLELCSHNRGYDIHAFTSYEDAIDWLCSTTEVP